MALSLLLESRETRCPDRISVTLFLPFQQPVAEQQRDATLADLGRCDHDHAPGAPLAEASCTGGGCWFVGHVTGCYYDIIMGKCPMFRARI